MIRVEFEQDGCRNFVGFQPNFPVSMASQMQSGKKVQHPSSLFYFFEILLNFKFHFKIKTIKELKLLKFAQLFTFTKMQYDIML